MLLNNCPFLSFKSKIERPYLAVKIINPHTGKSHCTFGLIDTGADECTVPAYIAHLLAHNFEAGIPKTITTGGGKALAYKHTTTFEIYHPLSGELLYTIPNTPVDFMLNPPIVLLGVNNFLSRFVLEIDYPNKSFSIKFP
jgi:hypothetical protein